MKLLLGIATGIVVGFAASRAWEANYQGVALSVAFNARNLDFLRPINYLRVYRTPSGDPIIKAVAGSQQPLALPAGTFPVS